MNSFSGRLQSFHLCTTTYLKCRTTYLRTSNNNTTTSSFSNFSPASISYRHLDNNTLDSCSTQGHCHVSSSSPTNQWNNKHERQSTHQRKYCCDFVFRVLHLRLPSQKVRIG